MWTPVSRTNIGSSNLQTAGTFSFPIPSVIPSNASEVLIYAAVQSGGSNRGPFHDITVFTQIGDTRYEKYLLLYSWTQDAINTKSDNMWLPMPEDRLVYIIVPAPHGANASAQVVAIGYR